MPAEELCGTSRLHSLIEGLWQEVLFIGLYGRADSASWAYSPSHLVDNLLVWTCFACTSQPTTFAAESTATDTAGFAFIGCWTKHLYFPSAVREQVYHFFFVCSCFCLFVLVSLDAAWDSPGKLCT